MCGITGVAGNLNQKSLDVLRDMMITSQVRGMDSAGVCVVPSYSQGKIEIQKDAVPMSVFLVENPLFDYKLRIKSIPKAVIAHARAATLGRVTQDNAHPFQYGNVIGVHNGSLTDWNGLEDYKSLDVDSKAIFNTIAKKGIDHTWKSFRGPAALVWWDQEDSSINMIRNEDRGLYVVFSEKKDAIFWASELWMITTAAMRNGVSLHKEKDSNGVEILDFLYLEPDNLYKFIPSNINIEMKEVRKLEKKPFPTPVVGRIHGTRGSNSVRSFMEFPRIPRTQIKFDWVENFDKADKSMVGRVFQLNFIVEANSIIAKPDGRRFFVGQLADKTRVEVYPQTLADWAVWKKIMEENHEKISHREGTYVFANVKCKFTTRPRVGYVHNNLLCYRISSDGVSVVGDTKEEGKILPFSSGKEKLYEWRNSLVNEKTWNDLLKQATDGSCSCVWCNSPIMIEDHNEIKILDRRMGVLGSCCANDEEVNREVSMYFP